MKTLLVALGLVAATLGFAGTASADPPYYGSHYSGYHGGPNHYHGGYYTAYPAYGYYAPGYYVAPAPAPVYYAPYGYYAPAPRSGASIFYGNSGFRVGVTIR
ncbi:MAG: hypothetical protein ACJ8C4_02025 [Gemmataceae bacterium]